MKKTLLALACTTALALSASAVVLVDYQFNDAGGTSLSGAYNAGVIGSFTNNISSVYVNGAGSATIMGVTSNAHNTARIPFVAPISSGIVTVETMVNGWSFTGDPAFARAYQVTVNSDALKLKFEEQAGTKTVRPRSLMADEKYQEKGLAGLSEPNGTLILRSIIDLDAGSYSSSYNYNGAGFVDFTTAGTWTNGPIENIGFGLVASSDWDASDTLNVDYLTVEAIPEPNSVAFIGVAAMATLALRNKKKWLKYRPTR